MTGQVIKKQQVQLPDIAKRLYLIVFVKLLFMITLSSQLYTVSPVLLQPYNRTGILRVMKIWEYLTAISPKVPFLPVPNRKYMPYFMRGAGIDRPFW